MRISYAINYSFRLQCVFQTLNFSCCCFFFKFWFMKSHTLIKFIFHRKFSYELDQFQKIPKTCIWTPKFGDQTQVFDESIPSTGNARHKHTHLSFFFACVLYCTFEAAKADNGIFNGNFLFVCDSEKGTTNMIIL